MQFCKTLSSMRILVEKLDLNPWLPAWSRVTTCGEAAVLPREVLDLEANTCTRSRFCSPPGCGPLASLPPPALPSWRSYQKERGPCAPSDPRRCGSGALEAVSDMWALLGWWLLKGWVVFRRRVRVSFQVSCCLCWVLRWRRCRQLSLGAAVLCIR